MTLSKSEMDGLLALAAKQPLRGDRRTDAKAGTIHGPTAGRLLDKGFVSKHGVDGKSIGYRLTPEGKAQLPGSETLTASKPAEPKQPDRAPAVLVPAAELPKPSPKANVKSAPPADVDAPNIVKAAFAIGVIQHVVVSDRVLSMTKAPADVPALLRPNVASEPSEPPKKIRANIVVEDGFAALCKSGSIVVETEAGRSRINAIEARGGSFEFWRENPETGFWGRLPLGNLVELLEGAKIIDIKPMPGKLPFAPIPVEQRERMRAHGA